MALSKKYKMFIIENKDKMTLQELSDKIGVGIKIIQRFIKTLDNKTEK